MALKDGRERSSGDGEHLGLIGLVLHKIDSNGQQFVNRFSYLTILWRSVWTTDPLNNQHFSCMCSRTFKQPGDLKRH